MVTRGAAEGAPTASWLQHKGEHKDPTCVVEGRASVDRGSPVGLDEPLGVRPGLSGPAAERREVKVAGEPDVRCSEEETADGGFNHKRRFFC